jgi:hypothetical protein
MAVTSPPAMTPAPSPAPQRGDRTTFSDRVDAQVTWQTNKVAEDVALAANVFANATDAAASAATAAANSAIAVAAVGVTKWVSGTTYAQGVNVWSPITFITYKRKIAGAGTIDPSADSTNWNPVFPLPDTTGKDGNKLSTNGGVLAWVPSTAPTIKVYSGSPTGTFSRAASKTGTYTQAGTTTVNATVVAHGLTTGDYVYLDFTSGTGSDGWSPVTVTGVDTFTATRTSLTTSGNVTLHMPIIITVTSQATHGHSAGDATFVDFSATFADAAFTVRQVTAASFQVDGSTGLPGAIVTTQGAGTAGTVILPTTNKTDTWTKPVGLVAAEIIATAGGSQANPSAGSYFGSAGGTSIRLLAAASFGATESVTVGFGGGTNNTTAQTPVGDGQSGATSSFGALCSATAGSGVTVSLAPGGRGVGGDVNLDGGPGQQGSQLPASGGASFFGAGGVRVNTGNNGTDAVAPGSGGGGCASGETGAFRPGKGARGIVIVKEYY